MDLLNFIPYIAAIITVTPSIYALMGYIEKEKREDLKRSEEKINDFIEASINEMQKIFNNFSIVVGGLKKKHTSQDSKDDAPSVAQLTDLNNGIDNTKIAIDNLKLVVSRSENIIGNLRSIRNFLLLVELISISFLVLYGFVVSYSSNFAYTTLLEVFIFSAIYMIMLRMRRYIAVYIRTMKLLSENNLLKLF